MRHPSDGISIVHGIVAILRHQGSVVMVRQQGPKHRCLPICVGMYQPARFGAIAKTLLGNTWWGVFRRKATGQTLSSQSKVSILAFVRGVKGQHNIFFGYASR